MSRWILRAVLAVFAVAVLSPIAIRAARADSPAWNLSTTGAAAQTTQSGGADARLDYRIRDPLTDGHCADLYVASPQGAGWVHIKRWCSGAWGYFSALMPVLPVNVMVCRSGVGPCTATYGVWP